MAPCYGNISAMAVSGDVWLASNEMIMISWKQMMSRDDDDV